MMRAALTINPAKGFLLAALISLFALTVHADDRQTCDDDSDCHAVYDCADVALNASHYDEWKKVKPAGCDATAIPRPHVRAICQKHQCILTDAPVGASLEWFACHHSDDCTKIYSCGDMAINKGSIDVYKTAHPDACLASPRPDPDAFAKCLDGQCTLMVPPKPKAKY